MRRLCVTLVVSTACADTREPLDPPTAPADGAQSVFQTDRLTPTEPPNQPPTPAPWDALVHEIAAQHTTWGMVDDRMHWAPGLCLAPVQGAYHASTADPGSAHAEKVFVLRAFDAMAYWKATDTKARLPETLARTAAPLQSRSDVRQVLVKESFVPAPRSSPTAGRIQSARKGDAYFGAGEPLGLFIMAQLGAGVSGTDEGWIYATVDPSGAITSAGDVAACRDCHSKQADRIFGVPMQWTD